MPRSFVGQAFKVSLLSGLEKTNASEGYVMSQFSVDIFCLTVPRIFVREPFCAVFQKVSGTELVYRKEGGVSRFSVENFLSHSVKKLRR